MVIFTTLGLGCFTYTLVNKLGLVVQESAEEIELEEVVRAPDRFLFIFESDERNREGSLHKTEGSPGCGTSSTALEFVLCLEARASLQRSKSNNSAKKIQIKSSCNSTELAFQSLCIRKAELT